MRNQWKDFIKWYENHKNDSFKEDIRIPKYITKWPDTSWLKHHIRYCIDENKYFVYPYCSYTTCFSDAGEHTVGNNDLLQVPLLKGNKTNFELPNISNFNSVKYDCYFERVFENKIDGYDCKDICVDLYCTKRFYEGKKYLLTSRKLPLEIDKEYSLKIVPHEENFISTVYGKGIYLYKINGPTNDNLKKKLNKKEFLYYYNIQKISKNILYIYIEHFIETLMDFFSSKK